GTSRAGAGGGGERSDEVADCRDRRDVGERVAIAPEAASRQDLPGAGRVPALPRALAATLDHARRRALSLALTWHGPPGPPGPGGPPRPIGNALGAPPPPPASRCRAPRAGAGASGARRPRSAARAPASRPVAGRSTRASWAAHCRARSGRTGSRAPWAADRPAA